MPRCLSTLVLFALLASACGKQIGDPCATNIDCATDGTRDCDLSEPGGYCTVNGCDELSCPSEAVCIRVFATKSRGANCREDATCASDQTCVPCASDQICLPEGFCVPRATERRFCEKSCGSNDDCRGGYVCGQAGVEGVSSVATTEGTIALVGNASQSTIIKFCAPAP